MPPNQRKAYLRDIVSVVCTTYLLGHQLLSTRGGEYFFLKALALLGANDRKPLTFNDIRGYIERYKAQSREIDWKVSAVNVLFKLTTGPIGRLLNSEAGTTLANILDKPVILELDSLGSETDRHKFACPYGYYCSAPPPWPISESSTDCSHPTAYCSDS